jgi:hypothetical protein
VSKPTAVTLTPAKAPSGQERPEVAEVASPPLDTSPTTAAHPCDVCPLRSTVQDSRFDYCEGCTRVERHCPGCQAYKPQTGWWWGSVWGLLRWVCAGCRFPPPDAETAALHPALASSHPALGDLAAGRDRFAAEVELPDLERRFEAAQALSRSAAVQVQVGDEAGLVVGRMVAALRDPGFAGRVDVDVSDVDVSARQRVTVALHGAAYSQFTPQAASGPLGRLAREWERWVDSQLPARPRAVTELEQQARDRAAVRAARERPVG